MDRFRYTLGTLTVLALCVFLWGKLQPMWASLSRPWSSRVPDLRIDPPVAEDAEPPEAAPVPVEPLRVASAPSSPPEGAAQAANESAAAVAEAAAAPGKERATEEAEPDPDTIRTEAEERTEELLARGEVLLEEGVQVPEMVIEHWRAADILEIAESGMGAVLARANNRWYRVTVRSGSARPEDVTVLTPAVRRSISNRGLDLTAPATAADLDLIRDLEEAVRVSRGLSPRDTVDLIFFPSASLDRQFAAKQVAAVEALGIPGAMRPGKDKPIRTEGELRVGAARVAYVIHTVRVGNQAHAWTDPERELVRVDDGAPGWREP